MALALNAASWTLEALGEEAVLLRMGARIDPQLNREVHALAARIDAIRPPWLHDIVPAYAALALFVDPAHAQARDRLALDLVGDWLARLADEAGTAARADVAVLEIPVCYDRACAPDLDAVARQAGIAADEVVARHSAGHYTVAMIGFAPGFPYLLGLDPVLATPRHATPRVRVPAGSVGIGGSQTGIYPGDSPGGWQLIGRTPRRLFDPHRDPPSLLRPGQPVRFVAVTLAEYRRLDPGAVVAHG